MSAAESGRGTFAEYSGKISGRLKTTEEVEDIGSRCTSYMVNDGTSPTIATHTREAVTRISASPLAKSRMF